MNRLAILSGRMDRLISEEIIPRRFECHGRAPTPEELMIEAARDQICEEELRSLMTSRLLRWLAAHNIRFRFFEDDPRLLQFATRTGAWTEPRQLFEGCILAFDEFFPVVPAALPTAESHPEPVQADPSRDARLRPSGAVATGSMGMLWQHIDAMKREWIVADYVPDGGHRSWQLIEVTRDPRQRPACEAEFRDIVAVRLLRWVSRRGVEIVPATGRGHEFRWSFAGGAASAPQDLFGTCVNAFAACIQRDRHRAEESTTPAVRSSECAALDATGK
jgi:hypothetical protein